MSYFSFIRITKQNNNMNVNAKSNVNAKAAAVKQGNTALSSKNSKTECTYCHEFGHTALEQYCPAMKAAAFFVYEASLKAKTNAKKSSAAVSGGAVGTKRPKQGLVSATVPKAVSKFAALSMGDSDSDSECDNDSSEKVVVESVVDEYPVLGNGNGVAIGGGGDGAAMSYRTAIMKSKPVATVADGCGGVGMTSLKLSGFMKRVRFEDVVSSSVAVAPAVVSTLPPPPPLVAVKKPWKHNRFVSDWNASSSDDDSDCD